MITSTWFLFFSLVILIGGGILLFLWLKKFTSPGFGRFIKKVFEGDRPARRDIEDDLEGLPWIGGVEINRRIEWLFVLSAIVLYLGTRLVGLHDYPSFFYADEAAHAVFAEEMVDRGWVYEGELLPTYFYNVDKYSLSVSIYLHCLPALLGIKTLFMTRLIAVLITFAGVMAASTTLRRIFNSPYWWSAILLFSTVPVWLLHSRTAFETAAAVSFFALFFWAYHRYLYESPKYIYLTWSFAALTFYTYNPGRVVIVAAGLLLLLSDFRIHWQNRKAILRSLWFTMLLSLPYFRFQRAHFLSEIDQLELLNSYWVGSLPPLDKLSKFVGEILRGLNPSFWFLPGREQMIWPPLAPFNLTRYGQIHWLLLPFVIIGLILAVRRLKRAGFRNILLFALAAPTGAALVEANTTRALFLIVPVMLLAGIGLSWMLGHLESRIRRRTLALLVGIALSVLSLVITRDSLVHVPTWPKEVRARNEYSIAVKVYAEIDGMIEENPERVIIVSPYWAYATSFHARFFARTIDNISFGRIDEYLVSGLPIHEEMIFVMLADEYARMQSHEAVESHRVEKIVVCDDQRPCFYFTSVQRTEPGSNSTLPVGSNDRIMAR